MTLALASRLRRLIPRWRSPRVSALSSEWDALQPTRLARIPDGFFRAALDEFEDHPSLPTALEVVAGGVVHDQRNAAESAARFLMAQAQATPSACSLAEAILSVPNHLDNGPEPFSGADKRAAIATYKASLRAFPANPLLWVELARAYLFLGQSGPAKRAMLVAVTLAPEHRFVLRAATRLLIHTGDADHALFLLDQTPRTLRDPWLLAARLATAQVAHQPVLHTKTGAKILASATFAPRQSSELAGALGSLEMARGNAKYALRFFGKSLEDPTENALAQAVITQPELKDFVVPESALHRQCAFEANAQQAYLDGRWKDTMRACVDWAMDEPFSSRPVLLSSFLASVILEDPTECARLCLQGLASNPQHFGLTNNLAVALANLGRPGEAQEKIRALPHHNRDGEQRPALEATLGLLAFRAGNPEQGRTQYEKALELAKQNPRLQALANLHLALEEIPFALERACIALAAAEYACKSFKDPAIEVLRNRVQARLAHALELENPVRIPPPQPAK